MLNILVTKYGKQITRDEAETITLQDCVNQPNNGYYHFDIILHELMKKV